MSTFTIATLTCNNRKCLFKTLDSVIQNTNLENIHWCIFAQGCSEEFHTQIREYFKEKQPTLHLYTNPENLGFSKGCNRIWQIAEQNELALFIEDDWTLAEQTDPFWLKKSIQLMNDRKEIDVIFMRKYMSDTEKWQYGWTRHIPYHAFQGRLHFNYAEQMKSTTPFDYRGHNFHKIPEFMFTTNPCLIRTLSYKKTHVYPLYEMNDKNNAFEEWKDSSSATIEWGWSEALSMEKTQNLYVVYMDDGLFYHNP
jgi:GT2 family glycosyltransferase